MREIGVVTKPTGLRARAGRDFRPPEAPFHWAGSGSQSRGFAQPVMTSPLRNCSTEVLRRLSCRTPLRLSRPSRRICARTRRPELGFVAARDAIDARSAFHVGDRHHDCRCVACVVARSINSMSPMRSISLIVGNAGRAIAEADLGAHKDMDLGSAVACCAMKRASQTPLIHQERPTRFMPGRMNCVISGMRCGG